MEELPTRTEDRVDYLKKLYIEDIISDEQFDDLLESAYDGGPPFHVDWFKRQPEVRAKRYTTDAVYLYFGQEFVVEGDLVVLADSDEIDRTVNVLEDAAVADFY